MLVQTPAGTDDTAVARAVALRTSGDFLGAAEIYLGLAQGVDRARAAEYRLQAAQSLIDAGERTRAKGLLDSSDGLDERGRVRRELLLARLALDEHRPYEALQRLEPLHEEGLDQDTALALLQIRALAYEQSGNHVEAARQRVRLEIYLVDQAQLDENRKAIWNALEKVHPVVLEQLRQPAPDTLSGWMELVLIARRHSADQAALRAAMADWNQRYPNHPGRAGAALEMREMADTRPLNPDRVALLLPLDGRFAAAAAALRDGFLSAWLADGRRGPSVSVYATNPDNVLDVYAAAVASGAGLIVGPLDKESAALFGRVDQLPVPVLVLNRIEQPRVVGEQGEQALPLPDGLFQFALAPEDEAVQVAQRAWQDGHTRAGVLVPDTKWGQRVADAFIQTWQAQGGLVVANSRYGSDDQYLSTAVAGMLHIDLSKQRAQALMNRLGRGDIETEPRRRQDIDMIFMAAFPGQGRQLRPQFQFHRASDLPVYATSHVFTGQADPAADRDLNGVVIGDMPWILLPDETDPELHGAIRAAWPLPSRSFDRLFAMGVDAYRLIPRLNLLRDHGFTRVAGVTGTLYADADARLHRELVWARFENGAPKPLEALEPVTPQMESLRMNMQ